MPDQSKPFLPDHTVAFLSDPYRFIGERCRAEAGDVFETRLLFKRTLCLSGPEAAALFYDLNRFQRQDAAPEPVRATLFGKGGVQGLDDAAHRQRKALFMRLTHGDALQGLLAHAADAWRECADEWLVLGEELVFYDAMRTLLTRAACRWAGLPQTEGDWPERTRQLSALFDEAAAPGLGHVRARMARGEAETWLADLIEDARAGRTDLPEDCATWAVAWHRDADDALMPPRIAAVELLNLLRPTVAVSVYLVLLVHALALHPQYRAPLAAGDSVLADAFIQEVRRWYPFFPAVAARVRHDFLWQGQFFREGRRVMLDLYGTNHDPCSWADPEAFLPERFLSQTPTPFNFIPQGGAEAAGNHRCPGEAITVALMHQAMQMLLQHLEYEVTTQNLALDYSRLPALPREPLCIRVNTVRF